MQPTRMKRGRRHRWLPISVFFIAYSVFQAVMTSSDATDMMPADIMDVPPIVPVSELPLQGKGVIDIEKPKEPTPSPDASNEKEEDDEEEEREKISSTTEATAEEDPKKKLKDAGYKENENMTKLREKERRDNLIPTVHPIRDNCTPPAIEQFPRPLMGQNARKHGGLIIHILVAVFTFIGLAIVCDEYFVSSLDRICEELKLAPDVAGATFMAAGSSAPELATVVIGVFCAQDDIGVSGVIGSAVFNIMFVISVCALCAGTVSHLNWWPLCRDCFFYAISILVMLCTICNGYVSWVVVRFLSFVLLYVFHLNRPLYKDWFFYAVSILVMLCNIANGHVSIGWPEALFMLMMYGVYCIALRFNTALERWAISILYKMPFKLPTREEQAALVTYKSAGGQPPASAPAAEGQYTQMEGQTKETPLQNTAYNPDGAYDNVAYNAEPAQTWDPNTEWNPDQAWNDQQQGQTTQQVQSSGGWGDSYNQQPQQQQPQSQQTVQSPSQPQQPQQPPQPAAPAYYKAKEYNPETAVDPLVKPIGANYLQLACWYVAFPVHWACRHTMPDCRGRWYPITFIISMLWISFYSYFMVWMITIIGYTLGIPDTVMGLTFVAAGVSVPDALSSLAVIKEGYGDMAVSNAVGSNVFDILVCLGLPWFIQTAIIHPGSHVNVISKGLIYSTLSLFSTVVFLVVATHANGWKLDRKYGAVLMVWYLLFITLASLYELNIFGEFNKPDCISAY